MSDATHLKVESTTVDIHSETAAQKDSPEIETTPSYTPKVKHWVNTNDFRLVYFQEMLLKYHISFTIDTCPENRKFSFL